MIVTHLHRGLAALVLAVTAAACGSGELSLTEYADEVEILVAEMEASFIEIDTEWMSQTPSVARAQEYWDDRLQIRYDFLESVESLHPPEAVIGMHEDSIAVFTTITDADVALRARVDRYETIDDHWQWVDTPEGQAAEAALVDVYEFCRDSQEEFDATKQREQLDDTPWLPSEMKEVVRVAFGCPPSN